MMASELEYFDRDCEITVFPQPKAPANTSATIIVPSAEANLEWRWCRPARTGRERQARADRKEAGSSQRASR